MSGRTVSNFPGRVNAHDGSVHPFCRDCDYLGDPCPRHEARDRAYQLRLDAEQSAKDSA